LRRPLAERQVVLAGVTILALAVSLAVTTRRDHEKAAAALPAAVGSYTALAATAEPQVDGKETACGVTVKPRVMGISSPVLPCGIRLYVAYHGRHVLAAVIGRGPTAPGAELGLTPTLARRLGVNGVKRIRWSYAAGT
jgi:peptidoglycan lytic transglycosylase